MSMLATIAILVGAVLGLRFRVLILVPAIGLAALAILVTGIAHSEGLSSIALSVAIASVALQGGYVGGITSRHAVVMARTSRVRKAWPQPHPPVSGSAR